MENNSLCPILLETDQDTFRQLATLSATEPRARLRSLLPLVDRLVQQGVPHQAIVASLAQAGLHLKPASLRQALWRWRRKNASAANHIARTAVAVPQSHYAQSAPPSASPAQVGHIVGGVTSKADLVRLRRDTLPIDLNQLADLGRQK